VSLSDRHGATHGGHLLPNHTTVFACEVIIEEFDGKELVRRTEKETGLALWEKETRL
jgi:predicted DNA-binding protein with PD1-like motif